MTDENGYDCPHPEELRRKGTKSVGGRDVRVEECGRCGRVVVHPADGQRALSERGIDGAIRLGAREVVLSLLGAFPNRPVFSRIVLMKESFLFEKELAREISINVMNLGFVPYKYGPYSKDIDDSIRELERSGFIHIERVAAGQKEVIGLSPEGRNIAQDVLDLLDTEQTSRLKRKRKAWDQLGYRGLLEKVYEEYPSYKTRSEIADNVKPRRRWV